VPHDRGSVQSAVRSVQPEDAEVVCAELSR
jgi:hypothetical protein